MSDAAPSGPLAPIEREWRRHTPRQRLARFALYLAVVAAVVVSIRSIEIIPEFLIDAPEQIRDLAERMWPIDFGFYRLAVHDGLIETFHIATLGTTLAFFLAVPFGVMAARNVTPSATLNTIAKFVLVASRSVNSLVWALLFVALFGPGVLAGTLAIAFRSIGFIGKLLGEALEEANRGSIEALKAAGGSWWSILRWGYWPQIKPSFWSIAIFRWDINIRESAVLGLVGAGGIGVVLEGALERLQWPRVAMILLAIFVVVVVAEIVSTVIRKRIL
jgi:phosphonate transport system permease protein